MSDLALNPGPMYVVDSPYEIARWRPLVNWVLYIPHAIIQNAMRTFATTVFLVYWVMLIFTGRLNRGLYGVLAMHERYSERASSHLIGFTEKYPPFDFNLGGRDNHVYAPITVSLPEPPETTSRWAALNLFAAIPHYLFILVLGVAVVLTVIFGWVAVLFTGEWPHALRDFVVRVTNYYLSVWAYVTMAVSDYPKFRI